MISWLTRGCNSEQKGNNPENVNKVVDATTETTTAFAEGIWIKASRGIRDGIELKVFPFTDSTCRLTFSDLY
jgi:hypothetical protein